MAPAFHSTDGLLSALEDHTFEKPPALIANAHVTGLSVARALSSHGVPVIALDRTGDGVAPVSDAVTLAGRVTYPLEDSAGFRRDLEEIASRVDGDPIAFGCMDEWVHALADEEPSGVRLPFSDRSVIDSVLDKDRLYATAERLSIPYPETYPLDLGVSADAGVNLDRYDPDVAAERLGFPLVLKPARKRAFEEAIGTNVIEVEDNGRYESVLMAASEAGLRVMAQEKVPVEVGSDCSLASYRSPDGEIVSVIGNARVRHPAGFGTSCVVDRVENAEIEAAARSVLDDAGYYGISESEFVYDADREQYVLLDINTRPWKWIGMPVAAGVNLPMAAYANETDIEDGYEPTGPHETRWVYLRDYLARLSTDGFHTDVLSDSEWTGILSGAFENGTSLTTGVYRPSDPAPAGRLIETEFSQQEYYCAC